MLVPKTIIEEYLRRFRLFKNDNQIADMIGVSRLTVVRWMTGENLPQMGKLPDIDKAFERLLATLDDAGFDEIANILDFDRALVKGVKTMKTSRVEGWLLDRLERKQKDIRRTYHRVLKDAMRVGISRGQLYRASVSLRVKKELTGFGSRRESVWRLPK